MDQKFNRCLIDEPTDLTPAEAAKAALTFAATLAFGKGAERTSNRLLREQQIDPTAPNFDKAKFLDEVKASLDQESPD